MIGIPICQDGKQVGTVCVSEFEIRRRIMFCPICERRTRFVVLDEGPESYYSPRMICVACGDSWSESELHERPFRRGWREEAKARARRLWDQAGAP